MKIEKTLSHDGFTLVELMVVGAILSVLMLAFTGYMYNQAKQTKAAENRQAYVQVKGTVLGAAAQPESLSASEIMQFSQIP